MWIEKRAQSWRIRETREGRNVTLQSGFTSLAAAQAALDDPNHEWLGVVPIPCPSPMERFVASIASREATECWPWIGRIDHRGYGEFETEGKTWRAHRWSYTRLVGPIPDGLVIDHLCRVRHCVNPAHLEPVTDEENRQRGLLGVLRDQYVPKRGVRHPHAMKTHCKRGHLFDEDNTLVVPRGRKCRACHRTHCRDSRRRLAAAT